MAAKEKINLLEVIPFRSAHITTKKESDGTIVIATFFTTQRNVL